MGNGLLAALVIAAAVVLCAAAMRGLIRWDRTLTGKGNASQAPGSPVCGESGPFGARCQREPHTEPNHQGDGVEWWPVSDLPVWPQDRATDITYGPAYLDEKPSSPGADRGLW